ncbi:MAG: ABC transporter substrate-binding protein, partial [Alphaproteobacteria bacterium]
MLESLTTVNEAGEVIPSLAESWTISPDGLTYTFKLAQGVTFHDGTSFDADDVKFSFDRAMAEGSENPSKGVYAPIESVTVIDPATIEIKLKNRDAFFLFSMAQGDASIVAEESVDSLKTNPIGTGAYKFDSWTRGDRLVLIKNTDHRDSAEAAMERIEIRFISDPAAASAALLSGELDAFPGFPAPELLPQFEADPRFTVEVGSTEGEVILAINNSKAPFDNIEVRRAISHAIDRSEIIDGAMYGRATPIGSFYPPHGPAYVDLTARYPHDTRQATQMFEAAGVAGSTMTLRVPP